MRVLQLAQFYPPVIGGEERHVRNLARGLAAAGHDVHVATLRTGEDDAPEDPGVRVHHLDSIGRRLPVLYGEADRPLALPVPDPLTTTALARVVREVQPEVIHAHNWIVNSLLPVPGARRVPLVQSLHDYSNVCATKRLMRDGSPCAGPSPAVCRPCAGEHYGTAKGLAIHASVAGGRRLREAAVDRYAPVSRAVADASGLDERDLPWTLVPNFVPDELVDLPRAPRPPSLGRPYLFFAGDLSAEKGVLTLLQAYAALPRATRPDLLLVGRPRPAVEARIAQGLPAGVRIEHGWPHERVVAGFQHCVAAVLPSEWPDPCPTTVLEAMALGAPLVTTQQGGIADMVADGESALVVRPGDVKELATALGRITSDPQLRSELAYRARERVRGYLQSSVVRRVEQVYDELVRTPA